MGVTVLMSMRKKGHLSESIVICQSALLIHLSFRQRRSSRPFDASAGWFVFVNIYGQ